MNKLVGRLGAHACGLKWESTISSMPRKHMLKCNYGKGEFGNFFSPKAGAIRSIMDVPFVFNVLAVFVIL
jgi:hypothetical protein